ncbi:scaffolding protein, partial [Lactococcus lactis]|nr:scaffolding protein [Lactococcus lactis]
NVKTFLNLLDNQRSQWEKARNTGTTPKLVPGNNDVDVFKQAAAKY